MHCPSQYHNGKMQKNQERKRQERHKVHCPSQYHNGKMQKNQEPGETSPYLLLGAKDQRLGAEQGQLPCGSIGTSSSNCQETETCIVRASNTPQQPLQNRPSGHLGGLVLTPWSAEEKPDGQHRRVDIPAHARSAHKGLLQKRLEEDLC